jgi:hypothetical protein
VATGPPVGWPQVRVQLDIAPPRAVLHSWFSSRPAHHDVGNLVFFVRRSRTTSTSSIPEEALSAPAFFVAEDIGEGEGELVEAEGEGEGA